MYMGYEEKDTVINHIMNVLKNMIDLLYINSESSKKSILYV